MAANNTAVQRQVCGTDKADPGWFCILEPHDKGPCAAIPIPVIDAGLITGPMAAVLDDIARNPGQCGMVHEGQAGGWRVNTPTCRSTSLKLLAHLALNGLAALDEKLAGNQPAAPGPLNLVMVKPGTPSGDDLRRALTLLTADSRFVTTQDGDTVRVDHLAVLALAGLGTTGGTRGQDKDTADLRGLCPTCGSAICSGDHRTKGGR